MNFKSIIFCITLLFSFGTFSCKTIQDVEDSRYSGDSVAVQCFKLRDANIATNMFPSVGLIVGRRTETIGVNTVTKHNYCTGTWIASNTFLTANHCLNTVDGSDLRFMFGDDFRDYGLANAYQSGIKPSKVLHYGHVKSVFNTSNSTHTKEDVAILVFDEDISSDVSEIVDSRPDTDEKVNLIGFGLPEVDGDTDIVKRIGTSVVGSYPGYANSIVVGKKTSEINAAALPGDSGSPLLKNNKVAGILSSYIVLKDSNSNNDPIVINIYVDVLSVQVRNLLLKAKDYGSKITDEILTKPIVENREETDFNSFTHNSVSNFIANFVGGSNLSEVVQFKSDGSCEK